MLRVKVKCLADEARIIRKEESRTFGALREELASHRRTVVRAEARASHIAYALIRGRSLDKIERPRVQRDEILWKKVRSMIERYGPLAADKQRTLLAVCRD